MSRKAIYSILGAIIIIVIGFLIGVVVLNMQLQPEGGLDNASWNGLFGIAEYGFIAIILGGPLGAFTGYKLAKRVDKREEEQKRADKV